MIIQKQILNQSKSIPPGFIFLKDLIKKTVLQVLHERSCSVKGVELKFTGYKRFQWFFGKSVGLIITAFLFKIIQIYTTQK